MKSKRPLLTSTGPVQLQIREMVGRKEWRSADRKKQWDLLERLGLLLRRPVRTSAEEQKGNLIQMEALPEFEEMEEERDPAS